MFHLNATLMGFSSIFKAIIDYFTTAEQEDQLSGSLSLFTKYLNSSDNTTIRMWVSDAPGYGHQTNTVNLLYQLTNSSEKNGYGYQGSIEVYYLEDKDKTVLTKLYQLLPELDNKPEGEVNNATVKLIEWIPEETPPNPVVNLGFTGAEDQIDDNGTIKSPELAKRLNTNYFLRLEPYLWTTPEEIQFLNTTKKTVNLTHQKLLNYGAFKQRAYWEEIPVPEPDWNYYKENGYANQVAVLQSLLSKTDNYDLGAVYSIRTKGNYELAPPPEERMFEVITGYMASQMKGTSIRSGAKPIVVLSMDNFSNRTGGGETPISQLIEGDFSSQESTWNSQLNPDLDRLKKFNIKPEILSDKERNQIIQLLKPHTYRSNYLSSVKASERIEYVWEATDINVKAKYSWLNGAKNRVLFVQLGRVPAPIFNYLLYKSAMPPVFEGQNTGNLALQFGQPYFHVARPNSGNVQYPTTLLGYSDFDVYEDYSNIYMPVVYVPTIVYKMQQIANKINFPIYTWPSKINENPSEIIGAFIREYKESAEGEYQTYYNTIKSFYQNPANDKFRIASSYLGYILQAEGIIEANSSLKASAIAKSAYATGVSQLEQGSYDNNDSIGNKNGDDSTPLDTLLTKLYENLDADTILNLFPGVYSAGPIFDFISGLLGVKVTLTNTTITPAKGTVNPTEIIVNGKSSVLEDTPLEFTITFTAPEGNVVSDWKMKYTGDWLTEQLPWLQFENPYISLQVADSLLPAQGSVGGMLQGLDLDLDITLPINDGLWQLTGHFDEPASISKFYQLAGGVNLVQSLPSPFNAFTAIGVTDLQLAYNTKENKIQYVSFVMATAEKVTLMTGLDMDSVTLNVLIQEPGILAKRSTSWSTKGKFTIGTGDNAGVIITSMNYPDTIFRGQLASGVIKVTDLFNLFLPGTVFNPQGYSPEITEFNASFEGTTGNYSVTSNLNFDWTFQIISGAPSITINEVGVQVQSENTQLQGGLSGGFTFGEGATAFSISLSANYSSDGGWIFKGEQNTETPLQLTALANQLLPSNWQIPSEYNYSLVGLNFSFSETKKYYEIGGATDGYWKIPFINLNIKADLKFGYGIYGDNNADSKTEQLISSQKAITTIDATDDKVGYYCTLNADIEWIGIKMKLFYDYNPDVLTFGFTWGYLTGTIVEKEVEKGKPKHWIGTLKFTESVSLGSIIEDAISWATGYKFGLGAPWSLLNSLPLNKLELIYDFTAETVSFAIDIGEINLGFCKIKKIGLNYQAGKKDAAENGVFITIDGNFFWITDENKAEGLSPNQIKWDAAKPEDTPSPSGQGNNYLDLRLLAMGQHVTIPGINDVSSVQDAIKLMADLPDTKSGEIPNIVFDPNSSWLIGMDFGILKLQSDDKKSSGKEVVKVDDSGTDYFIDMQIVFNDPNLYALRIALNGGPARIFKGLDFQILYRKISDSVGVYQAQITLPDAMRKIQLGQVNITLPVFGMEIYTNGDFLADLGFPYDADFTRSFTLQTIIYVPFPIPVMGSAGLYFGKKSSATSTEVPQIDNGTFNPVILLGVGIQFGLGYDFNAGILSAGFSLTIVTIIEGVLAKFNPYQEENTENGNQADIAPAYYYSIKGVVGIQGKLYGYVDFKIIKAEVNVLLSILADITITAYEPILLGITARVSVAVSVKINLGLFKIKISFSFDLTLRESFEIKVGGGSSPWHVVTEGTKESMTMLKMNASPRRMARFNADAFLISITDNFNDHPDWSNLTAPATKQPLTGYIGFGLSIAGDLAKKPSDQLAVYSAMLFLESTASAVDDPNSAKQKALGTTPDTSFEYIGKLVFRWVIAAFYNGSISAEDVDKLAISETRLQEIYDYLNNANNTAPIPLDAINNLLNTQVSMTVSHPSDQETESDAAYFPMIPQLSITLPAFEGHKSLEYAFADYNSLSDTYIDELRIYFDDLAVQLKQSNDFSLENALAVTNDTESMATFIYSDYFLLLAKQMVENAQNALRAFQYQILEGQTIAEIISWINTHGQFSSGYRYTIDYLFESNKSHTLNPGKLIEVNKATYGTIAGDTFDDISKKSMYNDQVTASALATTNANDTTILQEGIIVDYAGKDSIVVQSGNSLNSLAKDFDVTLDELLTNTDILTKEGLLMPSSVLTVSDFKGMTQDGDTLITFSARYGVSIISLAITSNDTIIDLFNSSDNNGQLVLNDLPQFEVGKLIAEIQADSGLQQLSGMASRYYLSGLRLPTSGITPKYQGMWLDDTLVYEQDTAGLFALTGQQFPLPTLADKESYDITFTIPSDITWISFEKTGDTLIIEITDDSSSYEQINTVRSYATKNYLDLEIQHLGLGDMFSNSCGHYTFSTVSPWKAGSAIALPYNGSTNESQILNIWSLPANLMEIANPSGRAVQPRFEVVTGAVDPTTNAMKSTPVTNYGWGTQVTFTIKKVPPVDNSPASLTTYEISGADGNNALLLEQMVTYLENNDNLINQLAFGYIPNQSNGDNPGVQTDPINDLTIGVAQANLSTFTRPDTATIQAFLKTLQIDSEASNLLNKPTDLITLLWQASITRDGGYYLYYYNSENGTGLPDHIFNDKGEASLSLIVLYTAPVLSDEQNILQPYMNTFVTGEAINVNNSSVYAKANPVSKTVVFNTGDTLSDLAYQYYTNIADVVEDNLTAILTAGLSIDVPEGTYQVGQDGSGQGESLEAIAIKFGTTTDAIKKANPLVTNWPDVLPLYFGLRLPLLTITSGEDNSKTLLDIATYYGMDLAALAHYNSTLVNLFSNGTQLTMIGGPITRVAAVPAGVVSLEGKRIEPAEVPDKYSDPDYAKIFLQNDFSILSFQLINNDWFKASKPSLPTGPTAPKSNDGDSCGKQPDTSGKWMFQQSVPYSKFANTLQNKGRNGLPDTSNSPYKGIGYLIQPDFMWMDIYGNTALTTISEPPRTSDDISNKTPILTRYTDAILGINQWPSVSSQWIVAKDTTAEIQIPLTFDISAYNGLLSAKATDNTTILLTFTETLDATTATSLGNYEISPNLVINNAKLGADTKTVVLTVDEMSEGVKYTLGIGNIQNESKKTTFNGQATYSYPDMSEESSSTVLSRATNDFIVYEKLAYQLTDPNGIIINMRTSLFDSVFEVGDAMYSDLVYDWIASIYNFLQDRKQGGTSVAPPSPVFTFKFAIDPTQVISDQIIELTLDMNISRVGGAVMGEFETTGGIKKVITEIAPSSNDSNNNSRALNAFAEAFEEIMTIDNQYYLKITTGANRENNNQQKSDRTIWAVRLGIDHKQPISYQVNTPGVPQLFAPRPVSNKLESRNGVSIYNYTTGKGISTEPDSQKDFTEIDMDQWVSQLFTAIDDILTPEFTGPIQLIDKKLGATNLKNIQDTKESLAEITKMLMVHVFKDETGSASAIQEAFLQSLLSQLSNLYNTSSGIQFDVNVKADKPVETAPNLFGNIIQNTVFEGAVSSEDKLTIVSLYFSAPLDKTSATNIVNYTITNPLTVKSAILDDDAKSVVLTISGNVVLNNTSVTIGDGLLDVNLRPIEGTKTLTITTNFVSYSKPDQLTITSAKIELNNDDQSLAFLLNTPEIVRSEGGEVLSKINLNLNYKGTNIEHQIATPINGFTPSTWLNFVIPDKNMPLENELGGFEVPMILRAFPQNPSLVNQLGEANNPESTDISKLLEWNYEFEYSQPFHYPQDTLYCTVAFNIKTNDLRAMALEMDIFDALAEFIMVYPSVDKDLKSLVTKIDAQVYNESNSSSEELFTNAGIAISSFTELIDNVTQSANKAGGLLINNTNRIYKAGNEDLSYDFQIREAGQSLKVGENIEQVQVITVYGKPPSGVSIPEIHIDNYTMHLWTQGTCDGIVCYYYTDSDGKPLLSDEAQSIQKRTVILPKLNILQRQDAMTSMYLTRNEGLIPGKTINSQFVYTTGELSFSNPLLPTITNMQTIKIANLPNNQGSPTVRSLYEQLQVLMQTLLKENTEPSLRFQMTCSYDYQINSGLNPINLPILMQSLILVELTSELDPMLQSWADAINDWFKSNNPSRVSGILNFDLVIFSNLTQQPYPLLHLTNLVLNLNYIKPALG